MQVSTSRRAFLGRHYTDLVLVAVVALCTQENDVIHAGYLALALLFFRRRDALRAERNRFTFLSIYQHVAVDRQTVWTDRVDRPCGQLMV